MIPAHGYPYRPITRTLYGYSVRCGLEQMGSKYTLESANATVTLDDWLFMAVA